MTKYTIESIRDLPMGDIEFRSLETIENYFKSGIKKQKGVYFFRTMGMVNPIGSLVLFRYKNKIRAFGVIKDYLNQKTRNEELKALKNEYLDKGQRKYYNGAYIFHRRSIVWLNDPIEKYEINLLNGCSKVNFSRAPNKYEAKCLEELIDLLNLKNDDNDIHFYIGENKLDIRRRKGGYSVGGSSSTRKAIPETEITFVHEEMKKILVSELSSRKSNKIDTEKDYIDILVTKAKKFVLYEIKTDIKPEKCIRNAIGQLLYYDWTLKIDNSNKKYKSELIVFGLYKLSHTANAFLKNIKKKLKVTYQSLEELYSARKFRNFLLKYIL